MLETFCNKPVFWGVCSFVYLKKQNRTGESVVPLDVCQETLSLLGCSGISSILLFILYRNTTSPVAVR